MKYIIPIILAIVSGILMAKIVLNQYDRNETIKTVFNSGEEVFFVSIGEYDTKSEMNDKVSNLPYYIYTLEDKYNVYMGITGLEKNVSKLEDFYQEKKYSTNIKKQYIDNKEFIKTLDQYDMLLANTEDNEVIEAISKQVINKYKELVLDEFND